MSAVDLPQPGMQEAVVGPAGPPRATNSQDPPAPARPKFDEAALRQRAFWTVPETAFLMRVGVRTVWRLMADPKSKFPQPRRVRGRTLLARDEVLHYLEKEAAR